MPARSRSPISRAVSRPSDSMMSIVASAAAAQTGLPANVDPCAPAGQVHSDARPMKAPIGMPDAMPFATVTMSGSTPAASIAHQLPVRPMPDWISSAMSRMPCSSHSSRRPWRNSGGAGK